MSRPNILVLMADQLTGTLFPDGPADWLHAPNLKRLAGKSRRFTRAYTASPLCAPARCSLLTGCLPSHTGVYDNAAEFPAALPTFLHHLRRGGYHTSLVGKMDFVGPDQLHGFHERMLAEYDPADFTRTPDWARPDETPDWWCHDLRSVLAAGVADASPAIAYDDQVEQLALARLAELARSDEPWCLVVSFAHLQEPFLAPQHYWDLYEGCQHLAPAVPALPWHEHDPHSRRLLTACNYTLHETTADDIARARRAYFASLSLLDGKIGAILEALEAVASAGTVIVFTSDHGEMLGERGLWFKMSFREGSARVPLYLSGPGIEPEREMRPVSTMDIAPTLVELAGLPPMHCDGVSLLTEEREPVPMEYAAEGSVAPMVALVEDCWKYTSCPEDPTELFDLDSDPHELTNLADLAPGEAARMAAGVEARWNLATFDRLVRLSQTRRLLIHAALRSDDRYPWEAEPLRLAAERYTQARPPSDTP